MENISKGSEGTLVVERIENIGGHYAKTLRLWKEKSMSNFESRIRPALVIEHEDMGEKEVEGFRKKWEVCAFDSASKGLQTDIPIVLLHLLRSWLCHENIGRRYYYCWS